MPYDPIKGFSQSLKVQTVNSESLGLGVYVIGADNNYNPKPDPPITACCCSSSGSATYEIEEDIKL